MGPLIFSMALPAMISMIINALYNIVDSIFVAKYSQDALAAVSLVYPIQMLVVAIGVGTGVGVNSLIARRLGEKRQEEADSAAEHGVALAVVGGIVFLVLGLTLSGAFIHAFGAAESVASQAIEYSHIAVAFSIFVLISMMCEKIQQSTGNMIIPMCQGLTGAIINIILDPLMIFGIGPFPEMGIRGAALATVIGQIFGMALGLWGVFRQQKVLNVNMREFKWRGQTIKDIYRVGIPTFVMNAIGSVTTTAMNAILMSFSATAVAVLGIYFKLQSFVFMPIFGLNQGAMPILGYNYGAGDEKRFTRTLVLSFGVAVAIMVVGTVLFWTMPEMLLKLFNGSDQMLKLGGYALRILALCFLPAACSIIMTTMFQALGKGLMSLIMSLLRQLVFIIPLAWVLGQLGGLSAVWFCYPAAEVLVAVIFIPIALKTIQRSFNAERRENGAY